MSIFYPAYSSITSISKAQNAVVGFAAAHDFTVGEIVSFRVSPSFGMFEMNNQDAIVLSITSLTITTDIDSSNYTSFVIPPYQIAITNIEIDTPTIGFTRVHFASNPFLNGQRLFFQGVNGTLSTIINLEIFLASNATATTIDIALDSHGLTYTDGGKCTIYPFSIFAYLPVAVPSSSGVIPNAVPPQTNLADAFDNIPTT